MHARAQRHCGCARLGVVRVGFEEAHEVVNGREHIKQNVPAGTGNSVCKEATGAGKVNTTREAVPAAPGNSVPQLPYCTAQLVPPPEATSERLRGPNRARTAVRMRSLACQLAARLLRACPSLPPSSLPPSCRPSGLTQCW